MALKKRTFQSKFTVTLTDCLCFRGGDNQARGRQLLPELQPHACQPASPSLGGRAGGGRSEARVRGSCNGLVRADAADLRCDSGFYGLPSRGHSGGSANLRPWSNYAAQQLPIFEASGALYPSVYLTETGSAAIHEAMMHHILNETKALVARRERKRPPAVDLALCMGVLSARWWAALRR